MKKNSKYNQYFDINAVANKVLEYNPNFDISKFLKAFYFAAEAHEGQLRKDGKSPYITHPVKVVQNLMKIHADEDVLIAALLHDVPEDTERTIEEVEELFGKTVAFLVDGITKLSKVHYQNAMPSRQIESLKKLFVHSSQDHRVILIKLADRLHNMQTLGNIPDPAKKLRIARETLEIYVPMANLMGIQDLKAKLEDLCFKYIFPTEYEQLKSKIETLQKARKQKTSKTINCIKDLLKNSNLPVNVSERSKVLYRIYLKMTTRGITLDQLENRIPLRIIVDTIPQCYQVLGIIHNNFTPKINKFRDYIATPKINGYQSLHTSIFGPEKLLTEIQIRTKQMDLESSYGIASYNWENNINKQASHKDKRSQWVKRIVDIEKSHEKNEEFMENIKGDILQNRIFVYTPQGRSIDLPEGASVIDFAYAIHTDIGNQALRASINGNNLPLTTTLKTNDIVKVITSPDTKPEIFWLSFAKTNQAQKNIKLRLKKLSENEKITKGKKRLQKELDMTGMGLIKDLNIKKLTQSIRNRFSHLNPQNINDVSILIAEGELNPLEILNLFKNSVTNKNNKKNTNNGITVNIKLIGENRPRLLKEVADILYRNSMDMKYLKGWSGKNNSAFFSTKVVVQDYPTIQHLFDELEQVKGVSAAYRTTRKGLFLSILFSTLAFITWIIHPLIIHQISDSNFIDSTILRSIIINGGALLLLYVVLISTKTIQKYFPVFRNKKRLWFLTFSVPALAALVLLTEMFYFGLELSLMTIFIEITIMYSYLVFSFINFQKNLSK